MTMLNTTRLRNYINDLLNLGDDGKPADLNHEDFENIAGLIEQAADELDASRASNLVKYRQSAMTQVEWPCGFILGRGRDGEIDRAARLAEQIAHAMLTAERVPDSLAPAVAEPSPRPQQLTPQAVVDAWNTNHPIGMRVGLLFIPEEGDGSREATTTSAAYLLEDDTPAVELAGSRYPSALSKLQVIDDVPPAASGSPAPPEPLSPPRGASERSPERSS